MNKLVLICMLFCFMCCSIKAQSDSLVYSQDFHFRPGLYLNFQQFRTNKPVPKSRVVSKYDSTSIDFLRQVVSAKVITYLDSSGALVETTPAKLWGFSENNSVYIRFNYDFYKVVVIGSLCHFTANYTTYMTTDPSGVGGPAYGTPVQSMQQYVIDMRTGRVYDFLLPNMQQLLQRDPKIYAEFMELRKGKRRKLMFFYLRKYNDAHPLYFPS